MSNTDQSGQKKVIGIPLSGEQLERFNRYKRREFIEQDAAAGRKLILERLAQIDKESAGSKEEVA